MPLDIESAPDLQEGRFGVDRQGRITEWDYGMAEAVGISAAKARGTACHEAVKGRDSFGRQVCGPNCPAINALRQGHIRGGASMVLRDREGRTSQFRCELTALPAFPGGALGRLSLTTSKAANLALDLAGIATIAARVPSGSLREGVEGVLDYVLDASSAEATEVFLAEPYGKGMVLSFHKGSFRKAFSQILRFSPGEGFPGIALARREPVYTEHLLEDTRYLRTQVKQQGFQSYVCAPLFGFGGVVGSISVAFRKTNADMTKALQLLNWVGTPLGLMVEAGLANLRQSVDARLMDNADISHNDPERRLHGMLNSLMEEMVRLGEAQGGQVLLRQGRGKREWLAESLGDVPGCPLLEEESPEHCPAVTECAGVVLHGGKSFWPTVCRSTPHAGGAWHCIPLVASGKAIGLLRLAYKRLEGLPPSRDVALLESVAASAAPGLLAAMDALDRARRADATLHTWLYRPDTMFVPQSNIALKPVEELGLKEARLDIRCFGHFELSVGGRAVTPAMIHRKKSLTLLKALLVQKGKPVSKEVLIEMLWPDAEADSRISQFYVLVHELRKLLEPGAEKSNWSYICNDADRYYFNIKSNCRLDVQEFGLMEELGRNAEEAGDVESAVAAYEQAVELYRGEFMEDEPFAEWCSQERVQYRENCLELLTRLAGLLAGMNHWTHSIRYLRRALMLDQLREDVHRQLMYALWASGRRDEAVRQYESCVALLCDELDVDPLPETEQMLQRIRANPRP